MVLLHLCRRRLFGTTLTGRARLNSKRGAKERGQPNGKKKANWQERRRVVSLKPTVRPASRRPIALDTRLLCSQRALTLHCKSYLTATCATGRLTGKQATVRATSDFATLYPQDLSFSLTTTLNFYARTTAGKVKTFSGMLSL